MASRTGSSTPSTRRPFGFRLRRPMYVQQTGVDTRTATRDLEALSDLGLLRPVGETKGRHYTAGPALDEVRAASGQTTPLVDPCLEMPARLALEAAGGQPLGA